MKRFIYMIIGVIVSMMLFSCDDSDSRYLLGKATGVDSETNLPKYKPYKPDEFFRQLQNGEKSVTYKYDNSVEYVRMEGDDKWSFRNYTDYASSANGQGRAFDVFTIHEGKVWSVYVNFDSTLKNLWNCYCDISGDRESFLICNELSHDSANGTIKLYGYAQILHYLDYEHCEIENSFFGHTADNLFYNGKKYDSYHAVELVVYKEDDFIIASSAYNVEMYQIKKIRECKEEILKEFGTTPEQFESLEYEFEYLDRFEESLSKLYGEL